jgi:2-polyprenyl-6-methoxyphenol hydroxylase-like FAD-dependent oxidoreductase
MRVLIAGGGVAALEAALALRELGEDRVSVAMLAPESEFWYRPLAVAEPFGLGEVRHFDLAGLVAAAGATFRRGHSPASTPEDASPRPPRVAQFLTTSCSSPAEPAQPRPSPAL